MYKLYSEEDERKLYGTYETDQEARRAIVNYCEEHNFESYYWNCYTLPESDEFAGGLHVDYGSWSHFFIIYKEG